MDTTQDMRDEMDEERETIRQLREELSPSRVIPGYLKLKITRSEGTILDALRKATAPVSISRLRYRVDAVNKRFDGADIGSIRVFVRRLRVKLRALNPSVEISVHYGVGYYLTPENATRLETALTT